MKYKGNWTSDPSHPVQDWSKKIPCILENTLKNKKEWCFTPIPHLSKTPFFEILLGLEPTTSENYSS
jgi:hypothetical protein